MIYNQIVTWTAFAVLAMFIIRKAGLYLLLDTSFCWIYEAQIFRGILCHILSYEQLGPQGFPIAPYLTI